MLRPLILTTMLLLFSSSPAFPKKALSYANLTKVLNLNQQLRVQQAYCAEYGPECAKKKFISSPVTCHCTRLASRWATYKYASSLLKK